MKITVVPSPSFSVEFGPVLVDALTVCATHHYDFVCRQTIERADGRASNGIVTIMRMYLDNETALKSIMLRDRDLQTLMKLCEGRSHLRAVNLLNSAYLVELDRFAEVALKCYNMIHVDKWVEKSSFTVELT